MGKRNNRKRRKQKTITKPEASGLALPHSHFDTDLPYRKQGGSRFLILLFTVVLPLSITIGAYVYPHFQRAHPFRVALANVGNLQLELDQLLPSAISPACGCFSPHPKEWRGIEFWSTDMTLESDRKLNRFSISSPFPAPVMRKGFFPFTIRLFSLPRYSNHDEITLNNLSQPEYIPPSATTSMVFDGVHSGDLVFTGSLRIRLQGHAATIGAWIPDSGSKIKLSKSKEPLTGEFGLVQVDDTSSAFAKAEEALAQTTLDLVAEHVILEPLDSDSPVYLFSGGTEHMVTLNPPNLRNRVILVIDSLFSTRISMGSVTSNEISIPTEHPSNSHIDPTFFSAHAMPPPPWTGATEHSYKLRIQDAFIGREEYDAAIAKLSKNDLTFIEIKGEMKTGMRYPPMPVTRGFTIFGSLKSWESNNTVGHIQVGGNSRLIGVPSLLRIQDIESLDLQHLGITIPFSTEESPTPATINMAGNGTVFLDHTEINGSDSTIGSLVMWVGLVGTFLGVCFAIYPPPFRRSMTPRELTVDVPHLRPSETFSQSNEGQPAEDSRTPKD